MPYKFEKSEQQPGFDIVYYLPHDEGRSCWVDSADSLEQAQTMTDQMNQVSQCVQEKLQQIVGQLAVQLEEKREQILTEIVTQATAELSLAML